MSKSYVEELIPVYQALVRDAVYRFPTLREDFQKDLERLATRVKDRGIHLLMVDLPALGKHLDRCLSEGKYTASHLALSAPVSKRVVIPQFLRGLYLLIFEPSGPLKEDVDYDAVFFLRQILYLAKNASVSCSQSANSTEVDAFISTDDELPLPDGCWNTHVVDRLLVSKTYRGFAASELYRARANRHRFGSNYPKSTVLLRWLDIVSGYLVSALGSYDPNEWRFRHGPGAISEHIGPTNKYCWRNWSDRLESEFPIADYGYHNHSSWVDSCVRQEQASITSNDPSSRLVCVPKTLAKPRLIAAEPSEHQWCQQNIWHYLGTRSGCSWISDFVRFRDQSLNQELCLKGSSHGRLSTVDLSAASDRVTCHAVGQLFHTNVELLSGLIATRTRHVHQEVDTRLRTDIQLRKYSTMGNATTFPVESLMFLAVALTSCIYSRRMSPTLGSIKSLIGEVAVFGDDIIVPTDSREALDSLLEILHFRINTDKSFAKGNFRESCGVDAFRGVDVTPIYWRKAFNKRKPETLSSAIDVSNNFYRKFLLETAEAVARTIRVGSLPYVAEGSGVIGLAMRTSTTGLNDHLDRRVSRDLQRVECLVTSPRVTSEKTPTNDDSGIHQYFTEDPDPTSKWSHGFHQRPTTKYRRRWVAQEAFISDSSGGHELPILN